MNLSVYVFAEDLEHFYRILLKAKDRNVVTNDIPTIANFYNKQTGRTDAMLIFCLDINTDHPESSFLLLRLNDYSLREVV